VVFNLTGFAIKTSSLQELHSELSPFYQKNLFDSSHRLAFDAYSMIFPSELNVSYLTEAVP
jgi:hypothetical protein